MNEKLKQLFIQANNGSEIIHYCGEELFLKRFADLICQQIENEAIDLISFIAKDYQELSHEKVLWQRNEHMKLCSNFMENLDKFNDDKEIPDENFTTYIHHPSDVDLMQKEIKANVKFTFDGKTHKLKKVELI